VGELVNLSPGAGCGKTACRFDERGVETEHDSASEASADERAGKRIGRIYTTASHLDSTVMNQNHG
jgi:hypothetical protein